MDSWDCLGSGQTLNWQEECLEFHHSKSEMKWEKNPDIVPVNTIHFAFLFLQFVEPKYWPWLAVRG